MSLKDGLKALQESRYSEAIELLETYCQAVNPYTQEYAQAQMALARAYHGNGQKEQAIALCQELEKHLDSQVSNWAKGFLSTLKKEEIKPDTPETPMPSEPRPKAGRVAQKGVKLAMKGVAANLAFASSATISLLFGMVLVLCLSLMFIINHQNPFGGFAVAVIITLIFNGIAFFISPWLMDLTQEWLYQTRWVSLAEIRRHSPEAAEIIDRVCRQKKLQQPRLGIIDDQNPTAFTYGSLPNSARLVVSQGLFTYLDDDEIATVYGHELGHIVHWDFAVMTAASTLVQITYLIYTFSRNFSRGGDNKIQNALRTAGAIAYVFYVVGTYLILYLSRTREYYADHFAAETTGNPNGLSRALVKIAYGILEEGKHTQEPSRLIEGTRALGIYDSRASVSVGTAYRVASDAQKLGRVFLWDMFNPWGWWMELNSTHPLTGKRIRALTTYAEQMGLDAEFDMVAVVREGKKLSRNKLYGNFASDIILFNAQWLGTVVGFAIGLTCALTFSSPGILPSFTFFGFGIGTLMNAFVMYPDFGRVSQTDIFSLMCDPYASPLRGRPVELQGELIGRGDSGYRFGSDLKLQDSTGTIFARYASRFGSLGNFLFGANKVQDLIGSQVKAVGWFRRGIVPWLDLAKMKTERTAIESYPRFWSLVMGVGAIIFGFIVPMIISR